MSCHQSGSAVARSWADLPPEILSFIGKRLATPLDVSCFLSVCQKWRSSLSVPTTSKPNPNPNYGILSPFLPLQIPNCANIPFNNRPDDALILIASAVFLVQPNDSDPNSKGWLLTVEEREAGKLRLLQPLSKRPLSVNLPSSFPNCLSLFKYRVTEISKRYSFKFASDGKDVCDVEWGSRARKVVLCSMSSITDCTAMVLYGDGILVGVRVSSGQWGYVRHSLRSPFENVGNYDNMVCALDSGGHVYVVDHILMKVTNTILLEETLALRAERHRKVLRSVNHHHVMESGGELYLIVWDYHHSASSSGEAFAVYKLNKGQLKWVSVETFDYDVLFVSPEWCFLVFVNNHIRFSGKAIVYSSHCFYSANAVHSSCSLFGGSSVDLGFHLVLKELSDNYSVLHYFDRDMADMVWLAPTWFWPDTFSSIGNEEDKDGQSDEVPCDSEYQDPKCEFSKVRFEADISPDLVPILQKVWAKHGNILEGSNVHSKFMISCALESLAKVVIILEGNSGTTLTEAQCNDMTSTMWDLRHLSLRVEWLVPFVEKAVALHISKPMIAALAELDKAIARANAMKMKVSDDLANMDELVKALEKDRICIFERMPIPGPINLDQCLAKGLF